MSTSSQSSASAVTGMSSAFDVNRSADDLIYSKQQQHQHHHHLQQQQQQQMTSSSTQRFHPYLVTSYGRDSSSSTLLIDRDLARSSAIPPLAAEQQQAQSIAAADSSFSGRLQQSQGQAATSSSSSSSSSVSAAAAAARRLREFIPDHKKDNEYWMKRQKNNEAAKKSREKRRINDVVMTRKILELTNENKRLKIELDAIKQKYGLLPETPYHHPVHDDATSRNQSVSPVFLGISSDDDSKPPSSYARRHSNSRSSPSPPILDRCHMDSATNRTTPDGKASLFRVTGTSQPYQGQPVESYHQPLLFTGQQFAFDRRSEQQQQQAKVNSLADAGALFGPLQYSSTSNILPVKNLCVRLEPIPHEIHSGMNGCKQQRMDEKASPYVAPSMTTSTTISGSSSSSSSSLSQNHPLGAARATLSALELPPLIFSDLSSDDNDDSVEELSGNLRHRMASASEAPLNLTKRLLPPWPLLHSSLGSSVVKLDPISTLRKNRESFLSNEEMPPCTSKFPLSIELSHWSTAGSKRAQGKMLAAGETASEVNVHKLPSFPDKLNIALVNRIGEGGMELEKNVEWEEGGDESRSDNMFTEFIVDPLLAGGTAQTPSRQVRGGVPLKVWHKRSVREFQFETEDCLETSDPSGSTFSTIQFSRAPAPVALSNDQIINSSSNNVNYSSENDRDDDDTNCIEYQEKRMQQNNLAAAKCHENRKLRTGMSLKAATILESENHQLKEELRNLSKEVTNLKERIDRKEQETHNGTSILESA